VRGFIWRAEALPSFAWWVFDCARIGHDELLDVIAQGRTAVWAHLPALRVAWRDAAGWPAHLAAEQRDIVRRVLGEGKFEVAQQLLDVLGVTVPGLSLGLDWLRQIGQAHAVDRSERAGLHRDIPLGGPVVEQQKSAAAELAQMLSQVAHPLVPAVVVVEDLHLMGPELDTFLTLVAQRNADHPVIVVGTSWPEGRRNGPYDRWLRKTRLAGNLELRAMPELNETDLISLLRRYAPATSDAIATRVVGRYQNPLALQLYLTLEDTLDQIADNDGALIVTPDDLADVPYSIRGLYELRWNELPSEVGTTLSYMAAMLPVDQPGWPSSRSIMTRAIMTARLSMDAAETVAGGVNRTAEQFAWIDRDAGGRLRFREALLAEIALEHISRQKHSLLQRATIVTLRDYVDQLRDGGSWLEMTEETLGNARWLDALIQHDLTCTAADAAALILIARAGGATHRPARAVRRLRERDWQTPLERDHRDTLVARQNLAYWLGEEGHLDDAIVEFEKLLADLERVLGADHPDTLVTRGVLAYWLGEAGHVDDGIVQSQQLLADFERVLGADDMHTLSLRHNYARLLAEAGFVDYAIGLFEQLLTDSQRVHGKDHPSVLATASNLAHWLGEAGRVGDAITRLEQVLVTQQRVVGPDHPSTLATRHALARWLAGAGQLNEAIAKLELLLIDRIRVFGSDHPETMATRQVLAYWIGASGRVDEAIERLEQLVLDVQRVLGPDNPGTLATRHSLAHCLGDAGLVDDAISELAQLLLDYERVTGPDHRGTLTTRHDLALRLGQTGRVGEAITKLEQLLIDDQRVFGPNHPDTLLTRFSLAKLYGKADLVDDAIGELEQLLVDQLRVLGPDHPDTLTTRHELAHWSGEAGLVDDAIAQAEQLIADRTRVLARIIQRRWQRATTSLVNSSKQVGPTKQFRSSSSCSAMSSGSWARPTQTP
jgi:tetratricopeptide (TPR) repeat protein